jgi:hypothetical protein
MSFAGILFACWLGIGGAAFIAFSGLGRLAARGDVEADLAIVGDAELRVLVGGRDEQRPSLEARLAQFSAPSTQVAWMSGEGTVHGAAGFTGSGSTFAGAGYRT